MAQAKLKIHSENILPIIKKWLYSEKDIFVRELISNSCDAIYKHKCLSNKQEDYRITVTIDKEKKCITFSDNGIGMSHEEVEKYIAQIAFSGAEEFLKKYQTNAEENQVIGHFGLGFYSSYMVASSVDIQTKKEGEEPVFWSCDGSSEYTIEKGSRSERGTDIILHVREEEEEFLEAAVLRKVMQRYSAFLPYPIYLGSSQINDTYPLWLKAPADCTEKEYLDFYQKLFPLEPAPLFWVHLNIDYPFPLKGICYFPKIQEESDLKKESLHLYCNRVFVSDNCKDLLPDYLMVLRGVIDSPALPLNVSRSSLQMDKSVRQLATHISKKIADRLVSLYTSDREKFISYWEDIEIIVKFGMLQDDKFYERLKPHLIWKNTEGKWSSLEEYLERHPGGPIYYTPSEHSSLLSLYKEKEVLIIRSAPIDTAMMQTIEMKSSFKFKRIDSHVADELLDVEKEKKIVDSEGKTEAGRMAQLFQNKLHIDVEAKSLASCALPALLLLKEEERRLRDQFAYHNKTMPLPVKPTLVINTNSKLINAIWNMEKKNPSLAAEMMQQVYDLACLSQREMTPEKISHFVTRSAELLEKLTLLA